MPRADDWGSVGPAHCYCEGLGWSHVRVADVLAPDAFHRRDYFSHGRARKPSHVFVKSRGDQLGASTDHCRVPPAARSLIRCRADVAFDASKLRGGDEVHDAGHASVSGQTRLVYGPPQVEHGSPARFSAAVTPKQKGAHGRSRARGGSVGGPAEPAGPLPDIDLLSSVEASFAVERICARAGTPMIGNDAGAKGGRPSATTSPTLPVGLFRV